MIILDQPEPATAQRPASSAPSRAWWSVVALILLLGATARIYPSGHWQGVGFDEGLYRNYALMTERFGVGHYPELCAYYLRDQAEPGSIVKLPPTRFLYIACGVLTKRAFFGDAKPADLDADAAAKANMVTSLHWVSIVSSILLMLVAGLAAGRMFGRGMGLAVFALVAASPLQLHLAQHGFIDSFFGLWAVLALWLLWENLRAPGDARWLSAYGVSLAFMVLTKESSFFVYAGLCGLLALNRWARFGNVTPRLLLVTVLGPLAGVATLVTLAGGLPQFIEIYRSLVSKAQQHPFAIATGDGPWFRYFIELMTISPIVFCLALTGLFTLPREHRGYLFLAGFVAVSFAIMCNVRYGMNLRYTAIWELPLSAFAAAAILRLAQAGGRRAIPLAALLVVGLCAYDVRQYKILFVDHDLYELVPDGMLRAVQIVKDPPL